MTPRPTDSSVAKAYHKACSELDRYTRENPDKGITMHACLVTIGYYAKEFDAARTLDTERGEYDGLSIRYSDEVLDPLWQRAGDIDPSYQTARAFDKILESADALIAEHVATIARLQGGEADRKDAERYRWLRSRDIDTIHDGGVFAGQTPENLVLNEVDLDAAIDAMTKESAE